MAPDLNMPIGTVVQINPETIADPMWGACLLQVERVHTWGVQGFIYIPHEKGQPPGQAYLRPNWEHIERVGMAVWTLTDGDTL